VINTPAEILFLTGNRLFVLRAKHFQTVYEHVYCGCTNVVIMVKGRAVNLGLQRTLTTAYFNEYLSDCLQTGKQSVTSNVSLNTASVTGCSGQRRLSTLM
jgi:hypothetical protein